MKAVGGDVAQRDALVSFQLVHLEITTELNFHVMSHRHYKNGKKDRRQPMNQACTWHIKI